MQAPAPPLPKWRLVPRFVSDLSDAWADAGRGLAPRSGRPAALVLYVDVGGGAADAAAAAANRPNVDVQAKHPKTVLVDAEGFAPLQLDLPYEVDSVESKATRDGAQLKIVMPVVQVHTGLSKVEQTRSSSQDTNMIKQPPQQQPELCDKTAVRDAPSVAAAAAAAAAKPSIQAADTRTNGEQQRPAPEQQNEVLWRSVHKQHDSKKDDAKEDGEASAKQSTASAAAACAPPSAVLQPLLPRVLGGACDELD
jgi:hypothetical protein